MFYCLHWVVPKLTLLKPNRKDQNLTPSLRDDSALIQQLWEQRPKTLEHLFHDLIGFSESSRFLKNREEKSTFGIVILLKSLDTTVIYTNSYLKYSRLGKLFFRIPKGRIILFRILSCYHRDLWYPCRLLKYIPSNDTESSRTHIQTNNLLTTIHNIFP